MFHSYVCPKSCIMYYFGVSRTQTPIASGANPFEYSYPSLSEIPGSTLAITKLSVPSTHWDCSGSMESKLCAHKSNYSNL